MTLEVIELALKPLFFILGTLKYIFSARERFKVCYRMAKVSKQFY
jgi:hypothetical protein